MKAELAALCVVLSCGAAQGNEGPLAELWLHEALLGTVAESGPAPFTTDGCSGGMSQVWGMVGNVAPGFLEMHGESPPWERCCVIHDQAYHLAGGAGPQMSAAQSWKARLESDQALQACVIDAAPSEVERLGALYGLHEDQVLQLYRWLGQAMFHAVRLGGAPCSGLPWRWGYGYPGCVMAFVP